MGVLYGVFFVKKQAGEKIAGKSCQKFCGGTKREAENSRGVCEYYPGFLIILFCSPGLGKKPILPTALSDCSVIHNVSWCQIGFSDRL